MTGRLTTALLELTCALNPLLGRRRVPSARECVRARNAISEVIAAARARGMPEPDERAPAALPVQCAKNPEEKFRAAVSGAHTAGLSIDRINKLVGDVAREIEERGASE
mgnify:CR=1 FL=1|tara:strand:+ start:10415 stop:10741 length:327 start_codon:yes stop_codon:yes gene_type:complete